MSGCPICKKAAVPEHRPFCSKRCSEIDLARWLGGEYAIPLDADEDETPPPPPPPKRPQ